MTQDGEKADVEKYSKRTVKVCLTLEYALCKLDQRLKMRSIYYLFYGLALRVHGLDLLV